MFSTYQSQDVTILLKDITGLVTPLGTREREARIQSGVHYSEMLPLEYEPSPAYLAAYHDALERYAGITAEAVARAAEQIWEAKGRQCALVSLARAGTPIGILIRRYLQGRYGADLPHYTISIIRGRGIDRNAMAYLLDRHAPGDIQFVDGWTGKGAIQRASGFQMKVLAYDAYPDEAFVSAHGGQYVDLDTLFRESDFITLHCPLNEETRNMVDAKRLAEMKPKAVLVNTARGGIIDEAALYEALRTGEIGAAGLDATEVEPACGSPLATLPNCILTPHAGAATYEAGYNMGMMAAQNALDVLNGRDCSYLV